MTFGKPEVLFLMQLLLLLVHRLDIILSECHRTKTKEIYNGHGTRVD